MGIVESINIINKRIQLICENTSYDLEVYQTSDELQRIGSDRQYVDYLNTIFPDSAIDRIVYHGTNHYNSIMENGFKFDDITRWNLGLGINFTLNRSTATEYGSDVVYCKINLQNYIDNVTAGYDPLKLNGIIEKRVNTYYSEKLGRDFDFNSDNIYPSNFFDGLVHDGGGVLGALKLLRSFGIDGTVGRLYGDVVITVTDTKNIHILGSPNDISGFRKFVL